MEATIAKRVKDPYSIVLEKIEENKNIYIYYIYIQFKEFSFSSFGREGQLHQ